MGRHPHRSGAGDLDSIAIERATSGDTRVRLTRVEQREAVRRMSDRGYSIRIIVDLLTELTTPADRLEPADRIFDTVRQTTPRVDNAAPRAERIDALIVPAHRAAIITNAQDTGIRLL